MFVRSYQSYIYDITSYRKKEEQIRTKQALDSPQMIEANKNMKNLFNKKVPMVQFEA